ncbi:MAG: Zn-dependent hydrolase [Anaerovoracaceae bacterium]|jgi:allantoate deiminase
METREDRLREMIETLADLTDTPGEGVNRFSYGENDKKAREYLTSICRKLGLSVRTDGGGNVFARLEGSLPQAPPVMTGSHIDSVKNGGRFDGIVGSVAALEAVRVMVEHDHRPKHPIDVVFFAEEEGSNFQVPVLGSKLLVGKLGISDLKGIKNHQGETAYEVMKKAGIEPDRITGDVIKPDQVKAMIELHIEQSVRLDVEKKPIGIVIGIAGLNWLKVTLKGCTNHAGATPMGLRQDPMVGAAKIISEIPKIAGSVSDTAVATVGNLEVAPNIPNAIPGEVTFVVDVRDITEEGIAGVVGKIGEATEKYARQEKLTWETEIIATTVPIKVEDYMVDMMTGCATEADLEYLLMPSGAIHDSNYIAEVTDVGMIFVPSVDGRSHVKDEFTKWSDIKAGADLLLKTLMEIAS